MKTLPESPITSAPASTKKPDKSAPGHASRPSELHALLERLPDAILFLDKDFRITFANAQARHLSRLTPADMDTKTLWEIFPETLGTDLEFHSRRAMSAPISQQFEFYYAPFDIWVDIHVFHYEAGIAFYYRDITDRKRAEAASEASAHKLKLVFESAPDSIVCIDRNWNCTFANLSARVILQSDDLVGANLWTAFPTNQNEPFASNYRTTMERGIPTEFEAFYPAPLNVWFKVFVRPFEDGIIIFSGDITARKKAETRRNATTHQLQQVLATTIDGVVSVSRDWTFTFLNRRAEEILFMKGDLIGKNVWEEFPDARATNFFTQFDRTMQEGIPAEFEEYYPEPLNMWLHVSSHPSDEGIVVFFRDVSAERVSRQILLEQQATLAFVQQTARVATWDMDLINRTVKFGEGSYPVYGRPFSELTTIDDLDRIIDPADLPHVQGDAVRAIDTNSVSIVDYRVSAPDGSTIWVECRRVPVFNSAGVPTHLRGVTSDITTRKQSQEKLAASEERYRVLADLNPQAIWMGSPEGQITYANQGFLDYIGLTMEQASTGIGWLEAFHPDDHPRVIEAWTRSVTTGSEYEIEARIIRAGDKAIRWWLLRALPVRDNSGRILNWLGVAIDIHDRKTHADELQKRQLETERQRAELESIYQAAPIGLALFDPAEFRYLRVNDRQAETLGLPTEQIIGRSITEVAPLDGVLELLQHAAAGYPVRNQLIEGELPTRPGEHRYWNVNYSPIRNPDGVVETIAAVVQEITAQKRAESALVQSEKLAAVGRLASSISHEINNPLEAITNILYLIERDDALSDELKPLVGMAQSELSRVCQIATQTLRFHRQAVRAAHVTAESLVSAVLNLYQGRLNNSGIHVEATYASATPILCFENDIRQVLNNLIANAIDAMRQHGGRLIVRAHDVTPPATTGPYPQGVRGVRITIADTGHGMTPEVRARIYEPFFTTKALNGTGLGLWISSGIVTRHKGRLTLRSSTHPIHHGTIFSLTLPIEVAPAPTTT
jgi:PAS domain S-box-containing protein